MYFSSSALVHSDSVSFQRLLRFGITPSNFPSFSPFKIKSITSLGNSLTGTFKEKLWRSASSERMYQYQLWRPTRWDAEAHGLIAPSAKVKFLFGMTSSCETSSCVPSPVQAGQAP